MYMIYQSLACIHSPTLHSLCKLPQSFYMPLILDVQIPMCPVPGFQHQLEMDSQLSRLANSSCTKSIAEDLKVNKRTMMVLYG